MVPPGHPTLKFALYFIDFQNYKMYLVKLSFVQISKDTIMLNLSLVYVVATEVIENIMNVPNMEEHVPDVFTSQCSIYIALHYLRME